MWAMCLLPLELPHPRFSSSSFSSCRAYLEEHVLAAPVERPVYLLGESFGALLSIAIAARRQDLVDR